MATIVTHRYKLRRATAAEWADVNPVLLLAEPGVVIDGDGAFVALKMGDGSTLWLDLPYAVTSPADVAALEAAINTNAAAIASEATARATADALLIPLTQKGAANGVATLGADSKIPAAQIPALALSDYLGTVASQVAMLALVGERGDWCIRSDTSSTWVVVGEPSSILGNWVQLPSIGQVASVNGRTGVVTGLQEAIEPGTYVDVPAGTPTVGQVPGVTDDSPLTFGWLTPAGGGGEVTQAELDDGLALKLDLADAAALSDNTPLNISTTADEGTGDESARWDHVHDIGALLDSFISLDGSDNLALPGDLDVAGSTVLASLDVFGAVGNPNGVIRAKNTGGGWLWQGLNDADAVTSSIADDGNVFATGFWKDSGFSSGFSWEGNRMGVYSPDGIWLNVAGAYVQVRSPDGTVTQRFGVADDGTVDVRVAHIAAAWNVNGVALATKEPNGTNRTALYEFGNLDIFNADTSAQAAHDTTIPLRIRWQETTAHTADLAQFIILSPVGASSTRALINNDGEFECGTVGKGVIFKSPDGTRYRLTVPNGGASVTIAAA